MKRKIVKQGTSTFTISLPAKWIKNLDVKNGDELEVETRGKELIVRADKILPFLKSEINLDIFDESLLKRSIISLYVKGVEEIKVWLNDKRAIPIIREIVNFLMGFIITEQGKEYCIIKEVSKQKYDEFETIMKNLFFTLDSIGEDIVEKIEKNEFESLTEFKDIEHQQINKMAYWCLRILNKEGYKEFSKTPVIYEIIKVLESIGDEYCHICEYLIENKVKLNKNIIEIFKEINLCIKELYFALYKTDKKLLNSTYDKLKMIRKEKIDYIIFNSTNKEVFVIYNLKKIAELMNDIIETQMVLLV